MELLILVRSVRIIKTPSTPEQDVCRYAKHCAGQHNHDQVLQLLEVDGNANAKVLLYFAFPLIAAAATRAKPACWGATQIELGKVCLLRCLASRRTTISHWMLWLKAVCGFNLSNLSGIAHKSHLRVTQEAIVCIFLPNHFCDLVVKNARFLAVFSLALGTKQAIPLIWPLWTITKLS